MNAEPGGWVEREVRARADTVCRRWLDAALAVYGDEYSRRVKDQPDSFANPVGMILREGLSALFAALVDGAEGERCRAALLPIVRLRAVQDMPPSQALAFVAQLKQVVREVLHDRLGQSGAVEALAAFDARIDQATLWAFDVYAECRERICELRIREMKRNTAMLWKRMIPDAEPMR
ncbi:MAG: RsbRD N-terminal domain-containing protein [Candidatus Sumerlaeia bacterium]|nr:RsbRD N-terminal domain-containing protein [Candidatus Sumerlaeia bacterium]